MNLSCGLNERQIVLLRESITGMGEFGNEITADFYERLFHLDPGLKFLFPSDMVEQHHSLIFMMGFVVRRLHKWDEICPRLRNLAIRHASYGVHTEDYATFGRAMMETLSQHNNDAETLAAWACLFELISATMIAAQR